MIPLLTLSAAIVPSQATVTVTDDFSSYGSHLDSTDASTAGHYHWSVLA